MRSFALKKSHLIREAGFFQHIKAYALAESI